MVSRSSFLQELGHIGLDLPETPEKTMRPPSQPVDPYLRYGPDAEITHLFKAPEKRLPQELSLAFMGLVLLPNFGFLVGVSFFACLVWRFLPLSCHLCFS
ncbi:proteasome regulatory particle base subunit [Sarracenia purpurea var. burkii]